LLVADDPDTPVMSYTDRAGTIDIMGAFHE
jgi:hypothetical protein